MSEARVLWLVWRYPHPSALARHARDGSVFAALRRLEARGFVNRQPTRYQLTRQGKDELAMALALARLATRRSCT
jgi:DNA-binding PadR family transcriptional regulator